MYRNVLSGNAAPAGANGTDLSIHPDFTGTVKIIDTNFTSSVFDPNGRIQTCNASDACTVGNHTGTCANADVGVSCYGCGMDNNQYGCRTGLSVKVVNPPSPFVPAGTQTLSVNVSDPRCDRWQVNETRGRGKTAPILWCTTVWAATMSP